MPLDEQRSQKILDQMKSMSVDDRLQAINAAKVEFRKCFTDGMSDKDYAHSAYVLESTYNILREELRVKQIRVKENPGSATPKVNTTPASPRAKAKTKQKPAQIDLASMLAEFTALSKSGALDTKKE